MMKPCQPLWRATLWVSFLLGYCMNPIVSILGIDTPHYVPLIGVAFSGVFLLMIFLAVPKAKVSGDGQKKPGGKAPQA
jgi:hypothetical protein